MRKGPGMMTMYYERMKNHTNEKDCMRVTIQSFTQLLLAN